MNSRLRCKAGARAELLRGSALSAVDVHHRGFDRVSIERLSVGADQTPLADSGHLINSNVDQVFRGWP